MKKPDVKKSFQNKNFKFGGYATIVTVVLVAILIVVNLIIGQLNIKFDLTKNKLFTLSPQTNKILKNLDQNITIYALYETGKENKMFKEIIEKYEKASDKIKVVYKDPILYPQFTLKYKKPGKTIANGSLIVENESGKFKVIDYYDLVNFNQSNYQATPESLAVEQRVTGAIDYVTSDKNPLVYVLQGHNEGTVPNDLRQQLGKENFTLKNVNLLTDDMAVSNSNTLLLISPKQDMTKEETQKLIKFFESGGRGVFLIDFNVPNLPNFESVLKRYGIKPQKGVVIEGDDSRKIVKYPTYLLPEMKEHDITSSLKLDNVPVMIPNAMGFEILGEKKRNTKVEPLLVTSKNSWVKTNLKAQTIEKEAGDIQGPINVALTVTEENYKDNNATTTKLVVIGNSQFINPVAVPGNMDLVMNSFNWLNDQKQNLSIRPKSIVPKKLNISSQKGLIYAGIFVILLPLVILAYGLSVWLRRRHL